MPPLSPLAGGQRGDGTPVRPDGPRAGQAEGSGQEDENRRGRDRTGHAPAGLTTWEIVLTLFAAPVACCAVPYTR